MHLLIDIGNSRLKWLYGKSVPGIVEATSYKDNWQQRLWRAWHLLPEPNTIALSNVKDPSLSEQIQQLVDSLWHKPVHCFIAQKHTNHTLTVAYEHPETLGTDRYLAMLGARALTQSPLCVVGCGTAITLDVIDASGLHLGGLIMPGIRLAENALLNNTHRLKPMRWSPQLLGTDTATCIGSGIHHAIPAGIDALLDQLEQQHGHYFKRYAFGGDAQILFGNLPTYCIEPDLIFRGMLNHLHPNQES